MVSNNMRIYYFMNMLEQWIEQWRWRAYDDMTTARFTIMTIAAIAYLILEFWFNARLLDVAGAFASDKDIHNIEIIGRIVSGIGLSLAVVGFIRPRRPIVAILAAAVVCMPAMYYGQKAIVDLIVDRSDANDRLRGHYMTLLKRGLETGVIKIDGIETNHGENATPEDKAFIAVIGGLLNLSPSLTNAVEKQRNEIVKKIASYLADASLDEKYAAYLRVRDEIKDAWRVYQKGSKAAMKKIADAPKYARTAWAKINDAARKGWDNYLKACENFEKDAYDAANVIRPSIDELLRGIRSCFLPSCKNRYIKKYHDTMLKAFHEAPDIEFWCENVKPGITDFLFRGSEPFSEYSVCPGSVEYIHKQVMRLTFDDFEKNTGFPYGIKSIEEYLTSDALSRKMAARAKRMGIILPRGWKLDDAETFLRAAEKHAVTKVKSHFMAKMRKAIGMSVPPGLSWNAFVAHREVQKRIRNALPGAYIAGMGLDYSKDTFRRKVLARVAMHDVQNQITLLETRGRAYADGGEYENIGRAFYRATVVPPIALGLSLFFAMLNSAFLLVGIAEKLVSRHLRRGAVMVAVIALIVTLPFLVASNKISESPTFAYFMQEAKKDAGIAAYPFEWMIRLQPAVYPIGHTITKLFPWFS